MALSFEDKINDIMDLNGTFKPRERSEIIKALKCINNYGIEEGYLLDKLKNLQKINYIDLDDMRIGYAEYSKPRECEFSDRIQFKNPGEGKDFGKTEDVEINIRVWKSELLNEKNNITLSEKEKVDNFTMLMKTRDFTYGVIDMISVHECSFEKNILGKDKISYEMGLGYNFLNLSENIRGYITRDLFEHKISPFDFYREHPDSDINDCLKFNEERVLKINKLDKHFDVLLDVNKFLIKDYFNCGDSYNDIFYKIRLEEVLKQGYKIDMDDFNKVYCAYAGYSAKDMSNDEFEFFKNRVSSLEGVNNEHLKILEQARENVINENKDIDNSYKNINEKIKYDSINELD